MAITYVSGDATQPKGKGPKIIAHICNDKGGWGRGFVRTISSRWSKPEKDYRTWSKGAEYEFSLGKIQLVQVQADLHVANMVAQQGYASAANPRPVCYDSIRQCLIELSKEAKSLQASVHMPRIGTGLGGGEWNVIEKIIVETLSDIEVVVYDLP